MRVNGDGISHPERSGYFLRENGKGIEILFQRSLERLQIMEFMELWCFSDDGMTPSRDTTGSIDVFGNFRIYTIESDSDDSR